jgi:hypothetical protein
MYARRPDLDGRQKTKLSGSIEDFGIAYRALQQPASRQARSL